jgi:hypothetical protein
MIWKTSEKKNQAEILEIKSPLVKQKPQWKTTPAD